MSTNRPRQVNIRKTADGIALVNLTSGGAWVFQYFPTSVETEDRVNWETQNVTIGVKPLTYENTEPQHIEIPEVWLDGSDLNEPLNDEIESLRSLMRETTEGMPPRLLLIIGDYQPVVILESLHVKRQFFDRAGNVLRALVSMSFIEFERKKLREQVSSAVRLGSIFDPLNPPSQRADTATGGGRRVFGPQP